jgi:hypothetical protein
VPLIVKLLVRKRIDSVFLRPGSMITNLSL